MSNQLLNYLKDNNLVLTTAESCTAGQIIHLLAQCEGSGQCLDAGYVVYSENAKKRLLGVRQETIEQYTLTSEEIAREMVMGALKDSLANVVVSTTGIAGSEPMDGIPPGTICFGWGFKLKNEVAIYSETKRFQGARADILSEAAKYALAQIPHYHRISQTVK
ncbi:CinA family protein [Legionella jordanis]|uniref:CinA-like competence damage protein n=1 Tax=Legionella jordanis TaxID=456 RepID=A0A0W0VC65_9GAMM|nr:nicotinamide-nucleotide amidohydrolase family protein [Legionella jordanis]KTD17679.1 CinA-like competence damage protein [Legionella jordanis]RMX01551.1 nicotinamide-nucleotide amidohydrolase family protein [Legionella jordanis]RMX21547.1 nicotinamide-nucleotide amidohydrolase family protein [Legionella jordanis]VEH11392.1 putative 17.2kDa protein, CinA-related competence damage protein [Legionella jordanis]HAT8715060.1 nicotinamide-nucleotide amidohydrolase family protein [Legionella jord